MIRTNLKRILAFVVFLSMMAGLVTSGGFNAYAAKKGKVTADSLNVRSEASVNSTLLVSIPKGKKLTIEKTVTNKEKEKWYQISVNYNNTTYLGYVMAKYVKIVKATTTEAATTKAKATTKATATTKAKATTEAVVTHYANAKDKAVIYKNTDKMSTKIAKLDEGTLLIIHSPTKVDNKVWYSASTKGLKTNYTGYVIKGKIDIQDETCETTSYKLGVTSTKTGLYKCANTTDERIGYIAKGKDLIILGDLTVGGTKWTKVSSSLGEGYVLSSRFKEVTATSVNKSKKEATITKKSGVRKIASLIATNLASVSKDSEATLLATVNVNGTSWSKVSCTVGDKTVTGYIRSKYVKTFSDKEAGINDFPASYQTYLTTLHEKHPNWVFKAVETGLEWSDVVKNESVSGRNTIQSTVPSGGTVTTYNAPFSYLSTQNGDYDWATDTYKVKDGTSWYSANSAVISYYLDPRNFLNEKGIYQFESLSYDGSQTKSVTKTMLKNTFMSGNYNVTDIATGKKASGSYATAFMKAAKASKVSPYYLVSRVKNEVGVNGSNSTSGTYGNYKGYYNFYNIGASDSSIGKAVDKGLAYASSGKTYNRPWTTPYKSIVGGAKYIATQYINLGQDTMYTQKFNVVVKSSLYTHQYMTAVTACNSYAISQYNTYNNNKLLDETFTFSIPVYKNMPSTVCKLPATAGNPNNYLKALSVTSTNNKVFNLDKAFKYTDTSYSMTVGNNVSKVNVAATAISTRAKVSGTGTKSLSVGANTITISCKAGNGTVRKYTIKITRQG
ncbi:MAG: SH3 domain-containing protein [Lachnospiraceae bacterium]|nr:SH3 domain-containing protein [Lachnospiraceae bacterium]